MFWASLVIQCNSFIESSKHREINEKLIPMSTSGPIYGCLFVLMFFHCYLLKKKKLLEAEIPT